MMRTLSRWAHRYAGFAISLLIFCEVGNGWMGVLLGANLPISWPGGGLAGATLVLLAGAIGLRFWLAPRTAGDYVAHRRTLLAAFLTNFLLFVALGAGWEQSVVQPSGQGSVLGSRQRIIRTDTTARPTPETIRPATTPASAATVSASDKQTGKRIGYVLLFVLGIGLAYVSAGLACNILCSGYGFLAALTLALGLGFLAGGIFFLGRATENPLKPMRELTQPERRRSVRRFWLSWIILIGATALAILLGSAT